MRYSRLVVVAALLAAVGVGAVAVARSSPSSPSASLRRTVQQEVRHLWIITPRRGRATAPTIVVPNVAGTTCFVATACSIRPCVVPVAGSASIASSAQAVASSAQAVVPSPQGTLTRIPNAVPRLRGTATGCGSGDGTPGSFWVKAAP